MIPPIFYLLLSVDSLIQLLSFSTVMFLSFFLYSKNTLLNNAITAIITEIIDKIECGIVLSRKRNKIY